MASPMSSTAALCVLVAFAAVLAVALPAAAAKVKEEEGYRWEHEKGGDRLFILGKAEVVVDSQGGAVRVVRGLPAYRYGGRPRVLDIGFISMEPETLLVPQYLDASLILFVRRGEVKVGWIHKDELAEKQLKMGDIIHIPAGATFYLVNLGKGQRLQIICSIDASQGIGSSSPYQAFFIGGGTYPRSVLAGFDQETLATAFNVTKEKLYELFSEKTEGPIVYTTSAKEHHSEREEERPERRRSWSWRSLLNMFVGGKDRDQPTVHGGSQLNKDEPVKSPEPYNIYGRDPDFRNAYGYSIALDEHDYAPLGHSDVGVYFVNLTAGSMLAPHLNPRAAEYGVVLSGVGRIQVVFPNGTLAMDAGVREGDVFWIPRFFPFCHIASRSGALEFFGFTTSARRNRPQFLTGAGSVLRAMLGPELAAGFGISEEKLRGIVEAQRHSVIIPSWPEPREGGDEEEEERRKRTMLIKQMIDA